jgi:hypothetical protein
MAAYSVTATQAGAWEKTLVASTVDTVTFAGDLSMVTVINEGTTGLYFSVDGTTPVVGDADAMYCPPAATASVPSVEGGGTVVKLISSGAPKYSVSGVY